MNSQTQITTIVPRLPPAIDGVGDYALHLAKQLRQDCHLQTEFIVGDANSYFQPAVEEFSVKQVEQRHRNCLLDLLPTNSDIAIVFLHYVGYGYAKRGCPVWLVEALESWRQAVANRHLVTMFHEIYAFGSIWTSQFWTSPLQRNLASRLVRLSDNCLTSKQEYAEIIRKLSQGKHEKVSTLPVFSNIGEPECLLPLAQRRRRVVVFGGCGPRARVYQQSRLALEQTCREFNIEEILDIGPPLGFKIEPVNGIPVICLGVKSEQEVSSLLSNSVVGFFDYPIAFLAKSGIFAAYCAHKLLPVGGFYPRNDVDGLCVGKHYLLGNCFDDFSVKNLSPNPSPTGRGESEVPPSLEGKGVRGLGFNLSAAQIVADNAYAWYQEHSLSVQARAFAANLLV
jgi:hypothetical protein